MAKIKTGECNSIKAELTEYLTKLQDDTKAVKTAIEGFNYLSNDKMDGADFNKVKAHLSSYSELFESIQSKIDELNVAQGNANDKMEKYVDEYSTYDVPEITDPVNNEDMRDKVKEQEDYYKNLYYEMKAFECAKEVSEEVKNDKGETTGSVLKHYTSTGGTAKYEKAEVDEVYNKWQKYIKAREYLDRLSSTDAAAWRIFSEGTNKILSDITAKNDSIKEMTIRASVKNQLIGRDPTGLDLNAIRNEAVDKGVGSYSEEYYNKFNADTNSDVGTVDSSVTPDGDNSGDTGAPATGDVSGIWGTVAAWILNR